MGSAFLPERMIKKREICYICLLLKPCIQKLEKKKIKQRLKVMGKNKVHF